MALSKSLTASEYFFISILIKPLRLNKYDSSLDDVRVKLQYDFYYIENMSLKLDFKIIINTIIVVVFMKGH